MFTGNRSTVVIDLSAMPNLSDSDMKDMQRSSLTLDSILYNDVFFHYNPYELSLFLSCDIWNKLYQFIFVEYHFNLFDFYCTNRI